MKPHSTLLCLVLSALILPAVALAGPDDFPPPPQSDILRPDQPVDVHRFTEDVLNDLPQQLFVPQGAQLLDVRRDKDTLHLTFSEELALLAEHPAQSDEFIHYLLSKATGYASVRVHIRDAAQQTKALTDLQESLRDSKDWDTNPSLPGGGLSRMEDSSWPFEGPLAGKVIVTSPGHGYTYDLNLGYWTTQRGLTNGLIEDISNANSVDRHLIPNLERLGARVFNARERDENLNEILVDDADGAPAYQDEEPFYESSYESYGSFYHPCPTTSNRNEAVYARFSPDIPEAGEYGVYVFYRAGSNRATDVRHEIHHAGGVNTVLVDQQENDRRWVYLGTYYFEAGQSDDQGVWVSNYSESGDGSYVIADAARLGGGMGSLERGGETSGQPRYKENSRVYVEYLGAPGWAYRDDMANDRDGDVTTRPWYANWQGADLYISVHSNAMATPNTARGTETFMYNGTPTEGSEALRDNIQQELIRSYRAKYDSSWIDRGTKTGNYGEVRELGHAAGALTELAFHDHESDAYYLNRPDFRETSARAMAKAVLLYYGIQDTMLPLPPEHLFVDFDEDDTPVLHWQAADDPVYGNEANPTSFRVYTSTHGYAFSTHEAETELTQYSLDLPAAKTTYVRVTALRDGMESLPSEPIAIKIPEAGRPNILLVNGFDRQDRYVQEPDNTRDYVVRHAKAMERAGHRYFFVSTSNEALHDASVLMGDYEFVDWYVGEESTEHESFSDEEQTLISTYLNNGGHMLVSGGEIGWDLVDYGSDEDIAFYQNTLQTTYESDDAESYRFQGVVGTLFDGVGYADFDDGTQGTYNVDYPDVVSGFADSVVCLQYDRESLGAAICTESAGEHSTGKLVHLGFPFETIVSAEVRGYLMQKILSRMAETIPIPDLDGDESDGDTENCTWDYECIGSELWHILSCGGESELLAECGREDLCDAARGACLNDTDGDEEFDIEWQEANEYEEEANEQESDEPSAPVDGDSGLPGDDACQDGYHLDGYTCVPDDPGTDDEDDSGSVSEDDTSSSGCRSGDSPLAWILALLMLALMLGRRRAGEMN